MRLLSAAPNFGERPRVVVLLRLDEAVQVVGIVGFAGCSLARHRLVLSKGTRPD